MPLKTLHCWPRIPGHKYQKQAELGVPHSRSKFSGPNQNCCQTSGLVLWLWVDFVLPLSQEEEEEEFSQNSECIKSLKVGMKTYLKSRVKGQVKKMFGKKNVVQKNVWFEKNVGPKKKVLTLKKCLVWKNFFWMSKNSGLKIFGLRKIFRPIKNLGKKIIGPRKRNWQQVLVPNFFPKIFFVWKFCLLWNTC